MTTDTDPTTQSDRAQRAGVSDEAALMQGAVRRVWRVTNRSPSASEIDITGWDFGGTGPVALLHHANGLCAAPWANVARLLSAGYRVFALDARGHGGSAHLTVPDDYAWSYFVDDAIAVTRAILDETGNAHLGLALGSSFGGIVLAAAQAQCQKMMERVVMLDPPIHATPELVAALAFESPVTLTSDVRREALVEQALKRRQHWPSRRVVHAAYRDKPLFAPWLDDTFDLYIAHGFRDAAEGGVELQCDPSVEAHVFSSTGSLGVMHYAHKVTAPLLFVHARQGFFAEDFYRRICAEFPYGEFAQLDAGHMLPLEAPQAVADLILDWVSVQTS